MTEQTLLVAEPVVIRDVRPYERARMLQGLAFWCIILNIAVAAVVAGLMLRRYAWEQTEPIRYVTDINNAFLQGTATLREGFLARYTNQSSMPGDYEFDYGPGRLMIATLWTRWVRTTVDGPTADWRFVSDWPQSFYSAAEAANAQYKWCRPLLMINIVGELASAIGVFLLVRQWTSGKAKPGILWWPQERPARSAILGLIAAGFFWFNPALIWNAHCWPQWDSWVLPFFLWALVAASADYWLCAGVLVATGAMFKGQILFGAPLFILWPLWRGQLVAILRWLIGVGAAAGLITSVWLMRSNDHLNRAALFWVLGVGVSVPVLWWTAKAEWLWFVKLGTTLVAILLVIWPLFRMGWIWFDVGAMALLSVVLLSRFAPRGALAYAIAGWVAVAMFACVPIFNGSMAWFQVGIAFGTHRYPALTRGTVNNLSAILESQWRWELMSPTLEISNERLADWITKKLTATDPHFVRDPGEPLRLPLKYLLFSLYLISMVLCSLGAAMHSKRGSPRFLVAISAPWILFFVLLPQMHQRYLLWGAAMSAATVALGPGYALLHLLVTAIAWSQEAFDQMTHSGNTDSDVYRFIAGWTPGVAWALMLVAAIFLYIAMTPDRKRIGRNSARVL